MNKLRLANLKLAMAYLSGIDLENVTIHYDSPYPASFQACAYAYGDHIYLGPGQEQHLPHELWHVVQQRQARVVPASQIAGYSINDDLMLEKEATQMGATALMISNTPDFVTSFSRPRPSRWNDLGYRNSTPVIQFTLEDAIEYVKAKNLASKGIEINQVWIQAYINNSGKDADHRRALIENWQKAAQITIPEDISASVPQPVPRTTIVNNNFRYWQQVSTQARNSNNRPPAGLAGIVPDIDLQTTLVNQRVPVFTQLNPMNTGNVDVKSTAFPNEPHTHQNMAAKIGLNKAAQRENAARNVMRLVKRTAIARLGPVRQKELISISDDLAGQRVSNASVAFATELAIAETHHGGATAGLAQAMAVLYVLKHGNDIKWDKTFYGTGNGGASNLKNLRSDDAQTQENALKKAYENLAEPLFKIYKDKFPDESGRSRDHLKTWLTERFRKWTAAYEEDDFNPTDEVDTLLTGIGRVDTKYAKAQPPKRSSTRTQPPVNYAEDSSSSQDSSDGISSSSAKDDKPSAPVTRRATGKRRVNHKQNTKKNKRLKKK